MKLYFSVLLLTDDILNISTVRRALGSKSPQQKVKSPRPRLKSSLSSKSSSVDPTSSTSAVPSQSPMNYTQYSNPTSYLIDKMFEGGKQSSSSSPPSSKESSPEQKLYKEAAVHDKSRSGKSLSTDLVNNSELTKTKKRTGKKSSVSESKSEGDDLKITEDVPVPVPVPVVKKEDKEDKVSEAGTYTIEAEEKNDGDETEARKRIDEVFGIDVDSFEDGPNLDPERMASPGGYDNIRDDGDKTPLDTRRTFPSVSDQDNLDIDDCSLMDNEDEDDQEVSYIRSNFIF